MNAPYLFLGLFFGLAIGYAIGWQQRRKNAKLESLNYPIQRIAGWSDAEYIEGLEGVVRTLRGDRAKLAQVSRVIADCDGPIRCTNCTEKRRCAAVGCVRLAEQCDPPLGMATTNPAPEQGGWVAGLDGVRRPNPAAGAPKPPFHNPVA